MSKIIVPKQHIRFTSPPAVMIVEYIQYHQRVELHKEIKQPNKLQHDKVQYN